MKEQNGCFILYFAPVAWYRAILNNRIWKRKGKFSEPLFWSMGFPSGSEVKNLPTKQETWVQSLGGEDALEKEIATHSSILSWRIPWTEEPGGLKSMESEKSLICLSH